MLCELCFVEKESLGNKTPGQFKFTTDETESNYSNLNQTRSFLNLKGSIRKHFKTVLHTNNWKAWKEKEDADEVFKTRVYKVGLRIAIICIMDIRVGILKGILSMKS